MFEKGKSGNPSGKPAGVPNKATALARESIARFVDGNVERLTGWLDEIASDDPKQAFNCFMDVVEYHIPKLARVEQSIDPAANTLNVISDASQTTLGRFKEKLKEELRLEMQTKQLEKK